MFIHHLSESNRPRDQNQLMDRTYLRANMSSVYTGSKQIYYLSNQPVWRDTNHLRAWSKYSYSRTERGKKPTMTVFVVPAQVCNWFHICYTTVKLIERYTRPLWAQTHKYILVTFVAKMLCTSLCQVLWLDIDCWFFCNLWNIPLPLPSALFTYQECTVKLLCS